MIVVETLLKAGADVNAIVTGHSVLGAAAQWGSPEMVERLLVDAVISGGAALKAAAKRGHVQIVERLLATGIGVTGIKWVAEQMEAKAEGGGATKASYTEVVSILKQFLNPHMAA